MEVVESAGASGGLGIMWKENAIAFTCQTKRQNWMAGKLQSGFVSAGNGGGLVMNYYKESCHQLRNIFHDCVVQFADLGQPYLDHLLDPLELGSGLFSTSLGVRKMCPKCRFTQSRRETYDFSLYIVKDCFGMVGAPSPSNCRSERDGLEIATWIEMEPPSRN
ncbi:hypothetical protein SUGI_0832160 [Cryptomeria japonica]|nr:hypothetical protein SUGI_0832160 [Cryptomeria japonica]